MGVIGLRHREVPPPPPNSHSTRSPSSAIVLSMRKLLHLIVVHFSYSAWNIVLLHYRSVTLGIEFAVNSSTSRTGPVLVPASQHCQATGCVYGAQPWLHSLEGAQQY